MIFKTTKNKDGNITIGNGLKDIKDLFSERQLFSKFDIDAMKAYNAELDKGIDGFTAISNTMSNASKEAQNFVSNANGAKINIDSLKTSSKAAAIGMQFFVSIINMAAMALASWAISKGIEWLNNYAHRVERASEALQEHADKLKSAKEEIDSLNDELKTNNDRIEELQSHGSLTLVEQSELETLQETNQQLETTLSLKQQIASLEANETKSKAVDSYNKLTTSSFINAKKNDNLADTSRIDYLQSTIGFINKGKRIDNNDSADEIIDSHSLKNNKNDINELLAAYNLLKQQKSEVESKIRELDGKDDSQSVKDMKTYQEQLSSIDTLFGSASSSISTYLSNMQAVKDTLEGLKNQGIALDSVQEETLNNAINSLNIIYGIIGKVEKKYSDMTSGEKKNYILNALGDSSESTKKYINNLSDDDLNIVGELTFDENTTVESIKAAIKKSKEEVKRNPITGEILYSSDFKTLNDSLSSLSNNAELLSKVNKEISNTGIISAENLKKINEAFPEDKYPDMTKALVQYQKGLITTQELFDELEKCYDQDKTEYIKALTKKSLMDTEFLDTMKTNYPLLFNELQGLYGEDLSCWKSLEQAKLDISAETVSQIAKLYQEFYKAMGVDNYVEFNGKVVKKAIANGNTNAFAASTLSKMYSQDKFEKVISDSNVKMNGKDVNSEYQKLQDNISNVLSSAEKMKGALDNYDNDVFDALSNRLSNLDWNTLGDDSSSSSSSSQTAEKLNWIERLINKISTAYSRLKNVVSDTTTTWLNRNNALSDSMSTLADEINAQSDAYEYYMNAFNSYGLDDYYKNQIADGSISIDVIYDDDLKNAISDCQDFYDKAQDAKTAVQELNIELKGLAKSRFDNVASEFEKKISYFKDYSDQLQKEMDIITTKGWFSSTSINEGMKKVEQDNLDRLKQERNALMNALNSAVGSGKIEKYSEDWYDMQSSIDSVTSSILDAEKALIEYDNAIRQIKWDAFDRTRDDVENLISETEFLVELLKDKGITDDNGNTTAEGKAAQALLVQKYQLYLNQAQKYKDEILKIDEELVNNPYDKELLDRKQDLIDKQQEAIKSSISEKDAIKDLVNDGYNDLLDALQKVIDKQKESLSAEKSLHDYQKTVAEQANTVAQLQKRLLALQGDNSESGQSKKQSISSELKDAQDQLEETEYEQYIEDQTKMLDDLATQAEEWINTRLDNLDGLIQQIIDDSNTHSGEIKDTITNTANEFGINLSDGMKSIWETNTNNINNNITSVFNDFGTKFDNTMTTLNNVVSGIESKVQEMLSLANEEAAQRQAELEEQRRQQEAAESNSSSSDDYSEPDYDWDDIGGGDSDSSSGGDGVDWIYSPDYFPKDQLNVNTSIVDRLKSLDYDSSFGARAMYFEQMGLGNDYTGSYDDNVAMLEWMKSRGIGGYRKGTKSATKGLHIYGEDNPGSEVLVTKYGVLRQFDSGDTVFNKDQVEKLWNLSKGITTPNMYMDNLGAKLPNITPVSTNKSVDIGGINVNVDKVVTDNPEDFTRQLTNELAGNSKIQKILGEINSNQLLGRNSLSTRRYMK